MNFESGTSLAVFQDRLIKQVRKKDLTISRKDLRRLNGNLWVCAAARLGPNNLVIRHRCLQDIFNGKRSNRVKILRLFDTLTPGLWAEGYSYWKYTKEILSAWANLYQTSFCTLISEVDTNFVRTAYTGKDGKLWPAPFGDLREEPLEDSLQGKEAESKVTCSPVTKIEDIYRVSPYPLGENLHTVVKGYTVRIRDGVPEGFKFYEGYDKKYTNKVSEALDMLSPRRIFSIFRLR